MLGKWIKIGSPMFDNPLSNEPGSIYQDKNGTQWQFKVNKRSDGWHEIKAKPYRPAIAYGVKADHWPVTALSQDGIDKDNGTEDARIFMGESIDSFVEVEEKSSAFPWLIALLILFALSKEKRR